MIRQAWHVAARFGQTATMATALLLLIPAAAAYAQLEQAESPTPAERAKQYEELSRETASLQRQGHILKKVVKLVRPTVVHIEAQKRNTMGRRPLEEAGSGVVIQIDDKPYVVTNRHVVVDARLADIDIQTADGETIHPTGFWSDNETDVAVLAVGNSRLVPARLGDSSKLEVGDFVLAIGSPFGLSHSVSFGIVSAKGRRDLQLGRREVRYQYFLQTDAAINPGNSGGPLINLRGEVVGINTAIASNSGGNEGIGFSIPINMVMSMARQLVEKKGPVAHSFLGVSMDTNFTVEEAARLGLPRPMGTRVTGITPKSPAAAAQLQVNDVVLQFDSVRVESDDHLAVVVGLTPVGKEVDVLLLRDRRSVTVQVKVVDRDKFQNRKS